MGSSVGGVSVWGPVHDAVQERDIDSTCVTV